MCQHLNKSQAHKGTPLMQKKAVYLSGLRGLAEFADGVPFLEQFVGKPSAYEQKSVPGLNSAVFGGQAAEIEQVNYAVAVYVGSA